MPRKQPAASNAEVVVEGNESYLDNFLNGVIEEANLPGELKRYLGQLRELDTHSQELFERMQRLSKNHVAKAKRSVQDGREPDEEYLAKARKTYRELVDIDEEKVSLADQMHAEARSRRGTREMLVLLSKVDNNGAPKTFDDPSPEPEGRKSSKIWRHRSTQPVVMSTPTQKRAMMSPSRAAKEAAAQREKEMKAWISGDPWSRDARGLF